MPYMTLDGLVHSFEHYNEIISTVARQTGAFLIDGEDEIPGDGQHFNDSVHFKDAVGFDFRSLAMTLSSTMTD